MAINVITEDRASGAQVIDVSLKFDGNSCLTRTFSSSGDRRTWTWSAWAKRTQIPSGNTNYALFGVYSDSNNRDVIRISGTSQDSLEFQNGVSSDYDSTTTSAKLRDTGWYHFVVSVDTDQSTQVDRVKIYVNGELKDLSASPQATRDTFTNHNILHFIGARSTDGNPAIQWEGYMSQVYFIDGQQLAPTEFGFTDELTNTWRPKKYEGTFGTNGFWLPFDGNSPIGKDQSGNNNDWTPVNFGGSAALDKATGALPILNTVNGGNAATVGVRTDAYANDLVLALPLVGSSDDVSNEINSTSTTKSPSVTGATFESDQSNFYGGGLDFDGPTDGASAATDYVTIADSNSEFVIGTGDFTMECWVWGNDWTGPNTNKDQVFMAHDGASGSSNYVGFYIPAGVFAYYDGSAFIPSSDKPTLNDQQWYHVAVSRESGTSRVFLDGALVGSASDTNSIATGTVELGRNPGNNKNQFNGYLQDFRLYVGTAKYTSSFIPAATNPDILPDTPSGVSGGSKLTKITDGAVSFDGTGDYLSGFGGSAILPTSTGTAFVVDCFWYSNGNSSQKGIWEQHSSGSGRTAYFVNNGSAYLISEGNTVGTFTYGDKRWYFTRIIYDGSGNIYHYVDGVLIGSGTQSNGIDDTGFQIGAYATDCFNGFISNFRIVVGSNSLSGTDIPTAPLTNITNTSLLCCQSPTSATAAAVTPGSITANGDAAATNFNPFNTDINTVRGQETGYCTWNPLFVDGGGNNDPCTLSNGNLTAASPNSGDWNVAYGSISASRGKYYWELVHTQGNTSCMFGCVTGGRFDSSSGFYYNPNSWTYYMSTGNKRNGSASGTSYGTSGANGDLFGVAMDLDKGTISIYKNGVSMGVMYDNLPAGEEFTALWGATKQSTNNTVVANFGQKPFEYAPPEDHKPLSLSSIRPEIVIARPDQYVGVTTWFGNGGTQQIDYGFQPDLVFGKPPKATTGGGWNWVDSVRGNKYLASQNTNNEADFTGGNGVTFNATGMSLIDTSNGDWNLNGNPGGTYVGSGGYYVYYGFKAGGNKNTFNVDDEGFASASAAGLTAGTITPAGASVGTKQGFSIVKFHGNETSGAKVPHGLSQTPNLTIVKQIDGTSESWRVKHSSVDSTKTLYLNQTVNAVSNTEYISGADSTTITLSTGLNGINGDNDYIMYAWHDVPGLQKFGGYKGSNNNDGSFIECGFKPALLWVKSDSTTGQEWIVYDSERGPINVVNKYLEIQSANTEATGRSVDFLSNGFKFRDGSSGATDKEDRTYIFCAWAEAPSIGLYGSQSTAR